MDTEGDIMSEPCDDWGMPTLADILGNLRVAETDGDVVECADALECWMSRVSVEAITPTVEVAFRVLVRRFGCQGAGPSDGEYRKYATEVAAAVVAWINGETK